MPSLAVAAAATRAAPAEDGSVQARFVVTNTSGRSVRAAVRAVPAPPADPQWLSVQPARVELGPGEAAPVDVTIVPPARRSHVPETYSFRIDVISEVEPDEDFTEGPSVSFEVPSPDPGAEQARWRRPALAAAVLALVAALVLLAARGDDRSERERPAPATAPVEAAPPETTPRTDPAQTGSPPTTAPQPAPPGEATAPDAAPPAETEPAGPGGADGVPPAGE